MSLQRVPEPQFLTASQEATEYHGMDHSDVNARFVDELASGEFGPRVVDLGCGPCGIAIELCSRFPSVQLMAIDAEVEMLEVAKREIDMAGLLDSITLEHADVTSMDDFADGMADTVISNSLVHHLDDPLTGLRTAQRLTRDGGRMFLRDLYRPDSEDELERLVAQYTGNESEHGQQLFRQSLHASLTLQEVRDLARGLGIAPQHVQMTSDRHWTLDWQRPESSNP